MNKSLEEIINRKKKYDPTGLLRAQREGTLAEYLAEDIKAIGLDPKEIKISSRKPRSTGKNDNDVSFLKFVDQGSEMLDELLYSKLYKKGDSTMELMLASRISDYGALSDLNDRLKTPKVLFAAAGSFCLLMSLAKLSRGGASGIVFAVLSADLFRMSYNCYIKRYCVLAGRSLFGNIKRAGSTLLSWAQSSLGIKDESEDPIHKLQEDVVWEAVLTDTVTEKIVNE
eukprot:gene10487-21876_t